MNQQELARLHQEAKAEFMKIPGVLGVGYGKKERAGKLTGEVAFRVYVQEKKQVADLRSEEVIPATFKGVPTDVIKAGKVEFLAGVCDDHDAHSPLIGGSAITLFRLAPDGSYAMGTLGFFAVILGKTGYNNIALVTCNHVLDINDPDIGTTVYQPSWTQAGTVWNPVPRDNPMADILKLPPKGLQSFTYPGEAEDEYYVDCAAAQLHICVSPTCKTNCSKTFANVQRGLTLNGSAAIANVSRLKHSDMGKDVAVYKSGGVTGVTQGIVIDPFGSAPGGVNNIMVIQSQGTNCHGDPYFGDEGDSGSAILDENNMLIGILFGRDANDFTVIYACHIDPVLAALDLELVPVTVSNAPVQNPAYVANPATTMAMLDERRARVAALQQQLIRTEEGARIRKLVEAHGPEVMELVNHNRRVTMPWHRNKGPLFLNEAATNLTDPTHKIPREIEGVARETLLRKMAEALVSQGSRGLREVVEQHLDEALRCINRGDGLNEMIDLYTQAHAV